MIDHVDSANAHTVPVADMTNSLPQLSLDQKQTYCRRIFKNIYIEKYGENHSGISSSCITGQTKVVPIVDFQNDSSLQKNRDMSRSGIRVPECKPCWDREDNGHTSQREINPGHDPYKIQLESMDYNVSPVCNARCIICSSRFSSSWAEEDKKHGWVIDHDRVYANVRSNCNDTDLDLSCINRIYFNGGEPLLSKEPIDMLQRIKTVKGSLSGLHVSLNTNGSIMPDDAILALWSECARIQINLSIDACGPEFHYIRFPLDWNTIVENTNKLCAMGLQNLHLSMGTVVGVHNFLEMQDLASWIKSLPSVKPISWGIHPAFGPFALNSIADDIKLRIKSTNLFFDQQDLVFSFLDHPGTGQSHNSWLQRLEMLDQRRGLDWRLALPKLARFLQ